MWSCVAGRPNRTRLAVSTTAHIRGSVRGAAAGHGGGRTSLSFWPDNACITTRSGMVPSQTTRGEKDMNGNVQEELERLGGLHRRRAHR